MIADWISPLRYTEREIGGKTEDTQQDTATHREFCVRWIGSAPAPRRMLRFFICSRDRPATLRRCINGLGHALREASLDAQAICYIVDDSTTPESSDYVHLIASTNGSNGLQLEVVDRARQNAVNEQLAGLGPDLLRLLKSVTRKLGEGPWDLARVRNLAFLLAYCYSNEGDLVVFLDDDILLTSAVYRGRFVEVDGASLIRELMSSTPRRGLVASGVAYFGQIDGSTLDHLRLVSGHTLRHLSRGPGGGDSRDQAEALLKELSLFPSTLPVQLAFTSAQDCTEGPGISGALLATTSASLHSHFLPFCYNEDWIWLALLGRPGAAIRRASRRALHAPPPQRKIGSVDLDYQNIGEVVYGAVQSATNDAPLVSIALERCGEAISVDHFLLAKESLMKEMHSLLDVVVRVDRLVPRWLNDSALQASARSALVSIERYIEDGLARVEAVNHGALYHRFRQYLADIPAWRSLLDGARARLCESIETYRGSHR